MFEGHTDVVTPGDQTRWQYDPFGAHIHDGRMFGRGANDTKGNLAAMLVAMAALKASGIPLAGSIVGGVLCDEEGMMTGVQHFIAQGHADRVTAAIASATGVGFLLTSVPPMFMEAGSIAAGFAGLWLLNAILGKEVYGAYAFTMATLQLLTIVATAGLDRSQPTSFYG